MAAAMDDAHSFEEGIKKKERRDHFVTREEEEAAEKGHASSHREIQNYLKLFSDIIHKLNISYFTIL